MTTAGQAPKGKATRCYLFACSTCTYGEAVYFDRRRNVGVSSGITKERAVTAARRDGWRCLQGQWVCPAC